MFVWNTKHQLYVPEQIWMYDCSIVDSFELSMHHLKELFGFPLSFVLIFQRQQPLFCPAFSALLFRFAKMSVITMVAQAKQVCGYFIGFHSHLNHSYGLSLPYTLIITCLTGMDCDYFHNIVNILTLVLHLDEWPWDKQKDFVPH